MNQPTLRIAIIGCGTAGPAAAALLKRLGHEIVLFERANECKAVGAGFLLQPSGMVVLERLGILDQVLAHAAKVERLHILDSSGETLLDLNYRELGIKYFGAGLHRPVLLHHLIHAMSVENVDVRWGWEIESISKLDSRWTLRSAAGDECGDFDLLIVADGVRSKLREMAGIGSVDRGYPWGAHWFIGQNNGVFPEDELHQVVQGTRRLGGFLATGHDLDLGPPLVSFFWSIKIADDASWRLRPLAEWKKQILELCPKAADLLSQITSWDQVLVARYGDVRMHRWYADGVVVIGDAAHAMSPQLGQGVNLALADASCLVDCLSRYPLTQALTQYQRRRSLTLRYYQFATRWLTPWFQSDHEWLTPIRRLFFGFGGKIFWVRWLMTLSMAGLVNFEESRAEKR